MNLEECKKLFEELLEEKKVSAFSTWKSELHKIVNDDRYLSLDSNQRKEVFESYCKKRAAAEKLEIQKAKRALQDNYRLLLKECQVNPKTSFIEFSNKFKDDPRFKAIERRRDREDLFDDYLRSIRRQEEKLKYEQEKDRRAFFTMLESLKPKFKKEEHLTFEKAKKYFVEDKRFLKVDSKKLQRKYFDEFLDMMQQNKSISTNSIKEREMEVAKNLEKSNQRRKEDRASLEIKEIEETFKAILHDLCKDPEITWQELRSKVHSDQRWPQCLNMKKRMRDELFEGHQKSLLKKYEEILQQIFKSLNPNFESVWSDEMLTRVSEHENFDKLSKTVIENLETKFDAFMKDIKAQATKDFKELLNETKIITHK